MYRITLFLLLILAGACKPVKMIKLMNIGEVTKKDFYKVVPFETRMGELIVKVEINGKHYDFLVDTGAPNCISKELAAELKLKPKVTQSVSDSQGVKNDLEFVALDSISLDGLTFLNTGAVIVDLKHSPEIACIGVEGFIGANLMRKAVWQINYKDKNFIISSSRDKLVTSTKQILIPFKPAATGTPHIDLEYNGVKEERITFDTGSNGGFAGKRDTYGKIVKEKPETKTNFGFGRTASGLYGSGKGDTLFFALSDVKIGDSTFSDQSVKFSSSQAKTVGNEFLKNFDVVIDWNKNEIALSPQLPVEVPVLTSFGFSPKRDSDKLIVGFIMNGFEAEKAGLKIGDQILSINGKDFSDLTDELWCGILYDGITDKSAGTVEIEVLQGESRNRYTLERSDIFR